MYCNILRHSSHKNHGKTNRLIIFLNESTLVFNVKYLFGRLCSKSQNVGILLDVSIPIDGRNFNLASVYFLRLLDNPSRD